jgi:hypothetical protein
VNIVGNRIFHMPKMLLGVCVCVEHTLFIAIIIMPSVYRFNMLPRGEHKIRVERKSAENRTKLSLREILDKREIVGRLENLQFLPEKNGKKKKKRVACRHRKKI